MYMFKMYIGLDEERMEREGLDVAAAWEQIQDMLEETGDIYMPTKGEIVTNDHGARCFLLDLLEAKEWFMKYVNKWVIDDASGIKEDAIKEYHEMGIKCNYE